MSQGAGARAFAWDTTRRVRADADATRYASPCGLKRRPHGSEVGARAFAWDATRRVRADADAKGYATPGGLKSRPHEAGSRARATRSRGPTRREAKLEPADARRPPALARLRVTSQRGPVPPATRPSNRVAKLPG